MTRPARGGPQGAASRLATGILDILYRAGDRNARTLARHDRQQHELTHLGDAGSAPMPRLKRAQSWLLDRC